MAKSWQYVLVTVLASAPIYFEVLPGLFSAPVLGLATLLVPYVVARYHLGHRETLRRFLIGSSVVIGIFSIVSGYINYLTDEWATPQYVSMLLAGKDWYSVPLQFQYVKMGTLMSATIWNVYLPLLPFIQIPYTLLDYRWFTLGIWGLMVYAVRKRYYASMALGGQYPALMAANGFNDVVPLLFLTLAFVTFGGRRSEVAKLLSLGMKQFANIFVFAYHVLRRDWVEAGLTVLVSVLFLLPFLVWNWRSAICTPILDMPPDCQSNGNLLVNSVHSRINFALWPVWVAAIFYPTLRAATIQFSQRFGAIPKRTCERLLGGPRGEP
jgi:hypothetical protein